MKKKEPLPSLVFAKTLFYAVKKQAQCGLRELRLLIFLVNIRFFKTKKQA